MNIIDISVDDVDEEDDMQGKLISVYREKTNDTTFTDCPCYCIDPSLVCKIPQLSKDNKKSSNNHKVITESVKDMQFSVKKAMQRHKAECEQKGRNVCVFMFLFDYDLSERIYIAKLGFIPADFGKGSINISELTTNPVFSASPISSLSSVERQETTVAICTFALPSPVLLNNSKTTVRVADAVLYLKELAVILEGSNPVILPDKDFFEFCELTHEQRTMAVNMLVVSLSVNRNQDAVNKIIDAYTSLISDCELHEKGFCMRKLAEDNPYYKPPKCNSAETMCLKVREVIMRLYNHYSMDEHRKAAPLAIKSLGYLFKGLN
jgi:hypothetical protein